MGRYSEHFTTGGTFKLHGIKVELDSVTIKYTQDESGIYATAIGAIKKTRRRGEVNLEENNLLDFLNNENDCEINDAAKEHAKDVADYQNDMRQLERDYWNDQFSAADLRSMRG